MKRILNFVPMLIVLAAADSLFSSEISDFKSYSPEFSLVQIESTEAPLIDGDLSDPAWAKAAKLERFYQVEPVEGGEPTEKTVARIMYDENNLYISVYAYEGEPGSILADIMQRDNDVWRDSHIRLFVDPYGTGRDGMSFIVNPLGAQQDRLIENNTNFVDEWDTIWDVEARIVDDGWVVELALPFRSISYAENIHDWNFDIYREIKQKNERIRWSQINQSLGIHNISNIGFMKGVRETEQGKGFDIQGFLKAEASRNRMVDPEEEEQSLSPSGNIYYKVTSSLTATLTFDTDFSDTPLDARQVNTDRFGLFFPETRDFMLQDQSIFEFGGAVVKPSREFTPNGAAFFSRTIGTAGNQITDIKQGAKLSGRVGEYNIGLLSTRMSEEPGLDSQVLSVARISKDIFNDSRVGAILTDGDPTGIDDNKVFGFDYQYRDTSFKGTGNQLLADAYYQRSLSSSPDAISQGKDDDAFGFFISYPNDHLFWDFRFYEIGEHFHPALGFVNRRGIRNYNGMYRKRYRRSDSWMRYWDWAATNTLITNLDDTVETHKTSFKYEVSSVLGDEIAIKYTRARENIFNPFSVAGRLPVQVGDYRNHIFTLEGKSSFSRPIQVEVEVECCEIYDGDRLKLTSKINWRMSKYFNANLEYTRDEFDLPSGELTVHVTDFTSSINFSPDMQIDTQVQYDNISKALSFFSRFRWFPRPETEYFASLGHTALLDDERFAHRSTPDRTELALRFGHTFRF